MEQSFYPTGAATVTYDALCALMPREGAQKVLNREILNAQNVASGSDGTYYMVLTTTIGEGESLKRVTNVAGVGFERLSSYARMRKDWKRWMAKRLNEGIVA